jgi:hypothetical protein
MPKIPRPWSSKLRKKFVEPDAGWQEGDQGGEDAQRQPEEARNNSGQQSSGSQSGAKEKMPIWYHIKKEIMQDVVGITTRIAELFIATANFVYLIIAIVEALLTGPLVGLVIWAMVVSKEFSEHVEKFDSINEDDSLLSKAFDFVAITLLLAIKLIALLSLAPIYFVAVFTWRTLSAAALGKPPAYVFREGSEEYLKPGNVGIYTVGNGEIDITYLAVFARGVLGTAMALFGIVAFFVSMAFGFAIGALIGLGNAFREAYWSTKPFFYTENMTAARVAYNIAISLPAVLLFAAHLGYRLALLPLGTAFRALEAGLIMASMMYNPPNERKSFAGAYRSRMYYNPRHASNELYVRLADAHPLNRPSVAIKYLWSSSEKRVNWVGAYKPNNGKAVFDVDNRGGEIPGEPGQRYARPAPESVTRPKTGQNAAHDREGVRDIRGSNEGKEGFSREISLSYRNRVGMTTKRIQKECNACRVTGTHDAKCSATRGAPKVEVIGKTATIVVGAARRTVTAASQRAPGVVGRPVERRSRAGERVEQPNEQQPGALEGQFLDLPVSQGPTGGLAPYTTCDGCGIQHANGFCAACGERNSALPAAPRFQLDDMSAPAVRLQSNNLMGARPATPPPPLMPAVGRGRGAGRGTG